MMDAIIQIQQLHKRFGQLEVLKGIDLDIRRAHITAIVGHNGSGKTTLIKSILGLVRPQTGRVLFDGEVINGSAAYRDRIGYMAQSVRFPENLCAADLFSMLDDLRGREARRRGSLIERFGLDGEMHKPLRTLSGGTRQKVSAAMAFMFEPDVLVLDEPTAGLDPVSSSIFKDLVREERADGKSLVLTSHIMSEIEELADEVVFLQDGKIRYVGDVPSIRGATGEVNLERAIARLMREEAA